MIHSFIHSFIHSCILQKAVDRTHLYNKTRELVKVQQLKHAITDKMKKNAQRDANTARWL